MTATEFSAHDATRTDATRMVTLRARPLLMLPVACSAFLLVWAVAGVGSAGALRIGPVKTHVRVRPVAAVAPTVDPPPVELPDPSVSVTPDDGVTVDVTTPTTVGPELVGPEVQVTVDPTAVDVTTTPTLSDPLTGNGSDTTSGAPPDPTASSPTAPVPDAGVVPAPDSAGSSARVADHRTTRTAKPASTRTTTKGADASASTALDPRATRRRGPAGRVATPGAAAAAGTTLAGGGQEVAVPEAVNASLEHAESGGTWTLAREAVTRRFGLWIALLALLAVARWALSGLVRDARRKTGLVSST